MTISLPDMGKRLRHARESKGLSIEAAAAHINREPRTIYNYESEGVRDILTLETLCNAYGVPLEAILFGSSPRSALKNLPDEVIDWCLAIAKAVDENSK